MTRKKSRADHSAALLMALIPVVLKDLRGAVDLSAPNTLTVPQMRTLSYIGRHPGSTLGQVAAHLGIGLPSASASVSRLCKKGLLEMNTPPEDRRSASLSVTPQGIERVRHARELAIDRISQRLSSLSAAERAQIDESLATLRDCFSKT